MNTIFSSGALSIADRQPDKNKVVLNATIIDFNTAFIQGINGLILDSRRKR